MHDSSGPLLVRTSEHPRQLKHAVPWGSGGLLLALQMTQKGWRVSKIDQSLEQLSQLQLQRPEVVSSLCLHGNRLKNLQGLSAFCCLETLNLSSNCLEGRDLQQELTNLTKLTALDLASNRISCLGELPVLASLKLLNLGHNFLTSLRSFAGSTGQEGNELPTASQDAYPSRQQQQALHDLDVRDNLLPSLLEIQHLQGLANLKQLHCQGGSPGNAFCSKPGYRLAVASLLPQLEFLDSQDLIIERLQLARDPTAASSFLAEAATWQVEEHLAATKTPETQADAHHQTSAAQSLVSQQMHPQQHTNRLPSGGFLTVPGITQPQPFAPAASVPFPQLLMQNPAMTASGSENQISSSHLYSPGMWDAAWQHMHVSGQQHMFSSGNPVHMEKGDLNIPRAVRDLKGPQLRQSPAAPAHAPEEPPLEPVLSPDSPLPVQDQASPKVRSSHEQPSRSDGQQQQALLSMFNAHLHQLLEQQKQSSSNKDTLQGDKSTRLPDLKSHLSSSVTAQQAGQVNSQELKKGGQDWMGNDAGTFDEHSRAASDRMQDSTKTARVDAACQAGEGGMAVDRLRHDADRC